MGCKMNKIEIIVNIVTILAFLISLISLWNLAYCRQKRLKFKIKLVDNFLAEGRYENCYFFVFYITNISPYEIILDRWKIRDKYMTVNERISVQSNDKKLKIKPGECRELSFPKDDLELSLYGEYDLGNPKLFYTVSKILFIDATGKQYICRIPNKIRKRYFFRKCYER